MAFMLFLAGALAVGTPQSSQDTEHKPPTLVFVQAGEHVEVFGQLGGARRPGSLRNLA
jgi:hypothetical protein